MPVKKVQKQKQKQTQNVIVHINQKPKRRATKRKPTTANPKKGTTNMTHFQPPISYNIPPPKVNNNDVANLIKKLSEEQASLNESVRRAVLRRTANPQSEVIQDVRDADTLPNRPSIRSAVLGTTANPQHEIVLDVRDTETLPDRPSRVHSQNDVLLARLNAQASAKSPFVFEEAEAKIDDAHRVENPLVQPQTPLTNHLQFIQDFEAPVLHQPQPEITFEGGSGGFIQEGEADFDTQPETTENLDYLLVPADPDRETAKDHQEFHDFRKSIGLSTPHQNTEILDERQREPTLAEKAEFPVAEARFLSPEAPFAEAKPAVEIANAEKVNTKTHHLLQEAGIKNVKELRDVISTLNIGSKYPIQLTRPGTSSYKSVEEISDELDAKDTTLLEAKQYHDKHSIVSPHNVRSLKGARHGKNPPKGLNLDV